MVTLTLTLSPEEARAVKTALEHSPHYGVDAHVVYLRLCNELRESAF